MNLSNGVLLGLVDGLATTFLPEERRRCHETRVQRFTELKVWQRAHALVLEVYRISAGFPAEERFALTSQLRRAVTSVPANIAEGSRRKGQQEYSRFLNIAQGSAAEAEYLLILSRDLGYLSASAFDRLSADLDEVARMLHGLRSKVDGA
jgi:four helix bundle protein